MLTVSDAAMDALVGHQSGRTYGLAQYQGRSQRVDFDQSGSVTFSADAQIQAAASLTAVGFGGSLVPKSPTDFLAPYGQEVTLFRQVMTPNETVVAEIPLGVFRIADNSGARETTRAGYVLDWEVSINLRDRFRKIQRNKLLESKSPEVGSSMYGEIRRLAANIPVQQSLPDRDVPPTMTYNDRLGAIGDLADLAGGVPHFTRQGALTLRLKDAWLTATVPVFDISATIPDSWQDGQSDEFFNYVRAASSDDQFVAYAIMADDSNPLSVNRAGASTYELTSPLFTSQSATQEGADTALARLLTRRSRQVTVTCSPVGALLELGDFGLMTDPVNGRSVLGEVSGIRIPLDVTSGVEVDLIVAEAS